MLHGVRETARLKMERLGGTTRKMRCDGALAACLKSASIRSRQPRCLPAGVVMQADW